MIWYTFAVVVVTLSCVRVWNWARTVAFLHGLDRLNQELKGDR